MANLIRTSYEFGPFKLDPAKRLLVREGEHLPLARKTFDLLLMLVESRGRVLTKQELMTALWPDTFVEEGNLAFQISTLRKVLGERDGEWIETVPRYGYRFCGEVAEFDPAPASGSRTDRESEAALSSSKSAATNVLTPLLQDGSVAKLPSGPVPVKLDRRYLLYALLVIVLTVSATAVAVKHFSEKPITERVVRFQVSPPESVRLWDLDPVALSPDGSQLVFIGVNPNSKRQLWIRSLGSLTPSPLKDTELVDAAFWSPDSRSIAFFAGGKLKKMDVQSGRVQAICDSPTGRSSGTWNRNGVILFESARRRDIYRVPADGGQAPKPIGTIKKNEAHQSAPEFLPDGHHFIYFVQTDNPEDTGIYVGSLESKTGKKLLNSFTNAVYARLADGKSYLLFTRGLELLAQPFDLDKLELVGLPFRITDRVFIEVTAGTARAVVSASTNGVIAYRTQETEASTELVWFDRHGNRLGAVGEPGDYSNPSLSPDEKKLIVSREDPQILTRDLWLFDLSAGTSSRFTFGPEDEDYAVWSRDGTRVAFSLIKDGIGRLYEKSIAGTSEPWRLIKTDDNITFQTARSWSPDGKFLIFGTGGNTWALPTDGNGKMIGPYSMEFPQVSPNGRWIAYTSDESGQTEVYVQSFPKAEGKWQISTGGGVEPQWRADGKELYYINGENFVGVDVRTDSPAFEPGAVKTLFKLQLETRRRRRYQVASNGQRFLANIPLRFAPITVEVNWAAKAER